MPLKKIPLPPGFDKNDTASQAEGRWIDGDNVRFQYGSPEKIGGWSQISSSILVGAINQQWTRCIFWISESIMQDFKDC